MICPICNEQMIHLNKGYGFSGVDAYQTYDYLECPSCNRIAIEFYHTEFVSELTKPIFSLGSFGKKKQCGGKPRAKRSPKTKHGETSRFISESETP